MKNYWLDKSKEIAKGKRVRYVGLDRWLNGKEGIVLNINSSVVDFGGYWEHVSHKWVEVRFDNRATTVEDYSLEVINE